MSCNELFPHLHIIMCNRCSLASFLNGRKGSYVTFHGHLHRTPNLDEAKVLEALETIFSNGFNIIFNVFHIYSTCTYTYLTFRFIKQLCEVIHKRKGLVKINGSLTKFPFPLIRHKIIIKLEFFSQPNTPSPIL